MVKNALPTTDLYFLNSCRDLVAGLFRRGPVRRLSANCFRAGNRVLVVRRDRQDVVDQILAEPDTEIIYLIDDDLSAADDTSLPAAYRARLAALRDGQYARLVARASLVVASSEQVAASLPAGTKVKLLNPAWQGTPGDGSHLRTDGPLDVAHLGTGSHGAGFAFIAPVIEQVLAEGANLRFHYFGNESKFGVLDADVRMVRHRLLTWPRYRKALPGFRFHLGLYPLAETPFNAGRSVNKILEYTLAGCPAIYRADWAAPYGLVHGENAFLAAADAESWLMAIRDVLAHRDRLAAVYAGAVRQFAVLNDLEGQRRFWLEHLVGGDL
ncbi:MAG: hypothetical protein EP335_01510 [Alphaproteobacteria bacterium]|nr:MAG: hypothetical protein EP335_01510 [Alphaproteobacteria bacterium]